MNLSGGGGLIVSAELITLLVLLSGVVQNGLYIFQLVVAGTVLHKRRPVEEPGLLWQRFGDLAPRVAVIAPAFNESATIRGSVRSMLSLQYPDLEVIIVNDGSKDDTLDILKRELDLRPDTHQIEPLLDFAQVKAIYRSAVDPRLWVLDKVNGGKADAQNAGISFAHAPLFCIVDGDTVLEPEALLRAVQPFIEDPERTVAVGGALRIVNGSTLRNGRVHEVGLPSSFLARVQIVEYLRSFLMARLAWSRLNCLMIISGAFGLFRKDVVADIGGYTAGSMGEDLDIVLRLHKDLREKKRDYRIDFVAEPMCWTEVPETRAVLARQRARWQNGALDCFFRYKVMTFNPRYGRVGFLGFGQILLVDVIGPILEVLGYFTVPLFWYFGVLSWEWLAAWAGIVFGIGTFVSIASLMLAEIELRPYPKPRHVLILGVTAVVENFGYRQLHNFWRLRGWWQYLRNDRSWGEMPRIGFAEA